MRFLCGVVALFLRAVDPLLGEALLLDAAAHSLGGAAFPPWRGHSLLGAAAHFLSVAALFLCGMVALFLCAADPLLAPVLLLDAAVLDLGVAELRRRLRALREEEVLVESALNA